MSERITRKALDNALWRFCHEAGFRVAASFNDIGAYQIDAAPCYGGYVVERISNKAGAVSRPFGDLRHSARDLFTMLHFASDAVRASREGNLYSRVVDRSGCHENPCTCHDETAWRGNAFTDGCSCGCRWAS